MMLFYPSILLIQTSLCLQAIVEKRCYSLRQSFLLLVSPALAFSTIDYCWLLLFVKQVPVPPFWCAIRQTSKGHIFRPHLFKRFVWLGSSKFFKTQRAQIHLITTPPELSNDVLREEFWVRTRYIGVQVLDMTSRIFWCRSLSLHVHCPYEQSAFPGICRA